jgi:hypothetical protein
MLTRRCASRLTFRWARPKAAPQSLASGDVATDDWAVRISPARDLRALIDWILDRLQ